MTEIYRYLGTRYSQNIWIALSVLTLLVGPFLVGVPGMDAGVCVCQALPSVTALAQQPPEGWRVKGSQGASPSPPLQKLDTTSFSSMHSSMLRQLSGQSYQTRHMVMWQCYSSFFSQHPVEKFWQLGVPWVKGHLSSCPRGCYRSTQTCVNSIAGVHVSWSDQAQEGGLDIVSAAEHISLWAWSAPPRPISSPFCPAPAPFHPSSLPLPCSTPCIGLTWPGICCLEDTIIVLLLHDSVG